MKEKEESRMFPRFVTWTSERLMVPFMKPRKGTTFGVESSEFRYRHVLILRYLGSCRE